MSISTPATEPTVKVAVDSERCIGSGMCEMLAEATFLIDEDTNIAGVLGTGELSAEQALIVVDRCPSGAISILESALASPGVADEEE